MREGLCPRCGEVAVGVAEGDVLCVSCRMEEGPLNNTAHDLLIEQTGQCPWCGSVAFGECPEPDGQKVVELQ